LTSESPGFCFAKEFEVYAIYLTKGGPSSLDLRNTMDTFSVKWYNPREGGALQRGSTERVTPGTIVDLGTPPVDPEEDWVALVKKI
jgi:hypothetical protein